MDFARPLVREDSVATKSNIRLLDEHAVSDNTEHDNASTATGDDNNESRQTVQGTSTSVSLDQMVVQAANQAARDLLLAGLSQDETVDEFVDASIYCERTTPRKDVIHEGDLVVVMESFDRLDFVYATKSGMYSNRNGHFAHDDFIGKPFGCKIRSRSNRGYGFCYLLKPTAELWARSLNHRTQIVHELDQSQIIFQLHLRPNMTVVESGTGSGAMSHGILRTIAPHGHLHTYEFNKVRSETAEMEFDRNGVNHLVTVHHRDVCAATGGGFGLPENSVDAVFLDLPEPWWAVPHAAFNLKPNARIASYSPCVEQTQRTVEALQKAGFHSIKTMEYRLQEHYVDEVTYEGPPRAKRPRFESHEARSNSMLLEEDNGDGNSSKPATEVAETSDGSESESKMGEKCEAAENGGEESGEQKKLVVARPFVTMRGHTAFLTFATAGNEKQPDPNAVYAPKKTD